MGRDGIRWFRPRTAMNLIVHRLPTQHKGGRSQGIGRDGIRCIRPRTALNLIVHRLPTQHKRGRRKGQDGTGSRVSGQERP